MTQDFKLALSGIKKTSRTETQQNTRPLTLDRRNQLFVKIILQLKLGL